MWPVTEALYLATVGEEARIEAKGVAWAHMQGWGTLRVAPCTLPGGLAEAGSRRLFHITWCDQQALEPACWF